MTEPFPVDVRPDALDWLTAIGTVGATVLAVIAIGIQIRDRRRREDDERRSQASLVSAWIERVSKPMVVGPLSTFEHYVFVRNGSEEIVYSVWLWPVDQNGVQPVEVGIVAPMTTRDFEVEKSVGDPGTIPFEIDFVDARGRSWTRRPDGRLVERQPKRQKTGPPPRKG
jgi:hypothetical protein